MKHPANNPCVPIATRVKVVPALARTAHAASTGEVTIFIIAVEVSYRTRGAAGGGGG